MVMVEYTNKDRDSYVRKGHTVLYAVLCEYLGQMLIKIGITTNKSFRGRNANNEYFNDGYHLYGLRTPMFLDEKDRVKISEAVELKEILCEIEIPFLKAEVKEKIEGPVRERFEAFVFPPNVKFSGKTEFVLADEEAIIAVKRIFNNIKGHFE